MARFSILTDLQICRQVVRTFGLALLCVGVGFAEAQDLVTLENAPDKLQKITGDEAMVAEFSAEKAARYLDQASLTWQKSKKCATCHTNMSYLFARPALNSVLKDSGEVQKFYEAYLISNTGSAYAILALQACGELPGWPFEKKQ